MIICKKADLSNESECSTILRLLNCYALDIMGGGEELSEFSQANLITELRKRQSSCHIFIASIDSIDVGLAVCFEGFSTFACRPLLNIHDFCVLSEYRRKGVASTLLFYIDSFARNLG